MSPAKEHALECYPPGQPPPGPPITPMTSRPKLDTMYRLPTHSLPSHYSIQVAFDIPARIYRGYVCTDLHIHHGTHHICFNAQNLHFESIELKSESGDSFSGVLSEVNDRIGVACISFAQNFLPAGYYKLCIRWRGVIRGGLQGVYLNRFLNTGGVEEEGVATMFAATEARSFFPCWDQPDIKCSFQLSVAVRKGLQVYSNMEELVGEGVPVMDEYVLPRTQGDLFNPPDLEEEIEVHHFQPSPKMSTYLLCFVIGNYASISSSVSGVRVSILTPQGRSEEGKFSLETSVECIKRFNEFFGIPYCLSKLDLIAVSCLSVGAMENWGLITFRENSLLVDSSNCSSAHLQAVATIVAHEISHQWFGNLVTMTWWEDLWLNEGFATFMQYLVVDMIYPQFQLWDQFCSDVLIPSLQLDALENSHPIKVSVENPQEIDEIFDKISYRKGASVIRMLHSVIGEEAFTAGIKTYIEKYAYGNARTEDLWESLSAGSKVGNVAELMDCWINNVGFPIIRVSMYEKESGWVVSLTQERFSAAHKCNDGLLWAVPITVAVLPAHDATAIPPALVPLPPVVMTERHLDLPLPPDLPWDSNRGSLVKLNPGFVCYYRTDYSPSLLVLLEAGLCSGSLPPLDRLSSLEDSVSLVLGEQGNTTHLLHTIQGLHREDSFLVWKNLSSFFHVLRCIVWSSEHLAKKFDSFVVRVMLPCLERIGWSKEPGESHLVSMMRGLLICQLGTRGCTQVEERCAHLFSCWVGGSGAEGHPTIEPGLREVVMKVAMAGSQDHSVFQALLRLLEVPQERSRVLHSLGYSRNKDVLARVLAFSLSPKLRDQESVMVIESVCQNRIGIKLAWDFFKDNIKEFMSRYGHGLFLMSKLIKCVTENFSTEEELTEVGEFFSLHPEIGCERTIKQAKENISLNLYWKNRDLDSVAKFLTQLY